MLRLYCLKFNRYTANSLAQQTLRRCHLGPYKSSPERGCDVIDIQLNPIHSLKSKWLAKKSVVVRLNKNDIVSQCIPIQCKLYFLEVYQVHCGKGDKGKWSVVEGFWMSLTELKKWISISPEVWKMNEPQRKGPSWYKTLPLTASCLSPLPGFESWQEHVKKLSATSG